MDSFYEEAVLLVASRHKLTKRQTDIVRRLCVGPTRTDLVAAKVGMSPHTVNNHLKGIFAKTGAESKIDVVLAVMAAYASAHSLPESA